MSERPAAQRSADELRRRERLVVFSDDWGRHPSSSQELIGRLFERYDVDWVNTIGTRRPRLNRRDLARMREKLGQWRWARKCSEAQLPAGLRVHAPLMWPSFAGRRARRRNLKLLTRALRHVLPGDPAPSAVITTVPLVADLARRFSHLPWIYYCVDALDEWPGLDGRTLAGMEEELLEHVRAVYCVSPQLVEKMRRRGIEAELLTHGIDRAAWVVNRRERAAGQRPRALFWGNLDERLDVELCLHLAQSADLDLLGRSTWVCERLAEHPHVRVLDPVPQVELRDHALEADVLVMPFRDLPVTRAMQPLKLKEYLATGLPAVVTPLPANLAWKDALDVAGQPEDFTRLVLERAGRPLPKRQERARERLASEGWPGKAESLERGIRVLARETRTVLHVRCVSGMGGGPEKTVFLSPRYLEGSGYRGLAAYLADPANPNFRALESWAKRENCPLIRIPDRSPVDKRVLDLLAELCRKQRVSIWHGHDYKSNLIGLALRRRAGLQLVSTVHGWVHRTWKTPLYFALDRKALRRYDRVLCVSRDLHRSCLKAGVEPERLRVVENGVETEVFQRKRRVFAGSPREGGMLRIGAVGRLSPEKGFDLLIDVVRELIEEGFDLSLSIAGEGGARPALEQRILETGHSDRIRLLGFRYDKFDLFDGMDLFVLSSLREGLPNALLEAMSMSLPLVATRVGGVEQLVDHEREGLLVPARDTDALRDAIRRLCLDPALRSSLAAGARRRVELSHDFAQRMRRVVEVYDSLCGRALAPVDEPVHELEGQPDGVQEIPRARTSRVGSEGPGSAGSARVRPV